MNGWVLAAGGLVAVVGAVWLLIRNWSATKKYMLRSYTKAVQVSAQVEARRKVQDEYDRVMDKAREADRAAWEKAQAADDEDILDALAKEVLRK